jgi:predicted RNase H-like HicB family nuclease
VSVKWEGNMLIDYVQAALKRAHYELLEEEEGWFATIGDFPGLWASAKTIEETRTELASPLEGWIILGLRRGDRLPVLDGIDLTPQLPDRKAS